MGVMAVWSYFVAEHLLLVVKPPAAVSGLDRTGVEVESPCRNLARWCCGVEGNLAGEKDGGVSALGVLTPDRAFDSRAR
jgi:hypothetical protein